MHRREARRRRLDHIRRAALFATFSGCGACWDIQVTLAFRVIASAGLCYAFTMASNGRISRDSKTGRFVLGRDRFEKISEVEGIKLSAASKKRAEEFDRRGISAAERRSAIISAHRRKG
jgi:hypothetical protein